MHIAIDNFSQTPIYTQLSDQLRREILSGNLSPGEPLPSIRVMAKELGIGIVTVKHAYDDLCIEGLLISIQGRGVFVSGVDTDKAHQVQLEQLRKRLEELRDFCITSDIGKEELLQEIEKVFEVKKNG